MRRTYRIVSGRERPTDEEIARFKDHARLQANYDRALRMIHRRPIYKDPRAFLAILMIVLITWLIMEAREERALPPDPPANAAGQ